MRFFKKKQPLTPAPRYFQVFCHFSNNRQDGHLSIPWVTKDGEYVNAKEVVEAAQDILEDKEAVVLVAYVTEMTEQDYEMFNK